MKSIEDMSASYELSKRYLYREYDKLMSTMRRGTDTESHDKAATFQIQGRLK